MVSDTTGLPDLPPYRFQAYRFQAKKEQLERVHGLLPASQGQNLVLTVLHVPYSLDSGLPRRVPVTQALEL